MIEKRFVHVELTAHDGVVFQASGEGDKIIGLLAHAITELALTYKKNGGSSVNQFTTFLNIAIKEMLKRKLDNPDYQAYALIKKNEVSDDKTA